MSSRSLSRLVTGATVALLAPVLSFVTAAPVSAAELTGSIVVSVEVEGRTAPLDGWQLTLSSANCAVPTAATATTDSTGAATFDGLTMFADESSTTPCLYDVEQERRDGFEQDTDDAELTGLTAGTLVPATTSGIAVASASGVFVNPTRNPEPKGNVLDYKCLTGIGTSEVRSGWHPFWRDCSLAPQNQTGLGFTANPTPEGEELPLGESTVATLTHFNQTILRGVHNYDLVTSFTFADRATGQTQTVDRTYTVRIDETSDSGSAADCKYQGADVPNASYACADRLILEQPEDSVIDLGSALVDLHLSFGRMLPDGTCGATGDAAYTAERANTEFCLIAVTEGVSSVAPTAVTILNVADATTPGNSGLVSPGKPVAPTEPTGTTGPTGTTEPTEITEPTVTPRPTETAAPTAQGGATAAPAASERPTNALLATGGELQPWLLAGGLTLAVGGVLLLALRARRTSTTD